MRYLLRPITMTNRQTMSKRTLAILVCLNVGLFGLARLWAVLTSGVLALPSVSPC